MEGKLLYKIHVTGRVQGVGYRWCAAIEARNRGITGYIKNLPNGGVYIEAEGSKEQLNDYIKWCKVGSGIGHVESVTTNTFPPVNYTDFRIEH